MQGVSEIIFNSEQEYAPDLWKNSFWKAMVHDMREQFGPFLIMTHPQGPCTVCGEEVCPKKPIEDFTLKRKAAEQGKKPGWKRQELEEKLAKIEEEIEKGRQVCPCDGCKAWRNKDK